MMNRIAGQNGNVAGRWWLGGTLLVVLLAVLFVLINVKRDAATEGLPMLVEYPDEAIPAWRSGKASPVLVLLSEDPFIEPVVDAVSATAEQLFKTGELGDLARKVSFSTSDPILLPTQSVRMALRSGVISGLTWIVPLATTKQPVNAEALRTWLLSQSMLSDVEKASLQVTNAGVVGRVEGRPFRAMLLGDFKGESGPSHLHVDLSYYHTVYRNEIKTPLYQMVQSSVEQLLQRLPDRQGVTISSSTAHGDVPLTLRFLGPTLKTLFADPTLLQQPLNKEWSRRRDMLYLVDFHQVDKMVALAKSNVAALPNDAATQFDLYRAYMLQENRSMAEAALTRACELDAGYVYEYRNLAVQAIDLEDSATAVNSLRKALRYDSKNVFFKLDLARVQIVAGEVDAARVLLRELQLLPWSGVFYPTMPKLLNALVNASMTPALPSADRLPEKQRPVPPPGHGF